MAFVNYFFHGFSLFLSFSIFLRFTAIKTVSITAKDPNKKIAIAGASTTGMYALIAASYYPEITLTIAMTPADFVMEGFYQGKRDGQTEWPGEGITGTG